MYSPVHTTLKPVTAVNFACPGSKSNTGFTLLELLVVVIIVSVLFTFMVLAIRTSSPEDLLAEEAHRFDQLIQLALEESILRGLEYGIEFNTHSYRFLSSVDGGEWQAMDADKMLRTRELPLDMELELAVEETIVVIEEKELTELVSTPENDEDGDEDEEQKEEIKPQVFLLSSGEITPEFSVRFVIPDVETSYIVEGNFDGQTSAEISEL